MNDDNLSQSEAAGPQQSFPTTRWTLISQVRGGDASLRKSALEALCGAYWYPIYTVVRERGYPSHDAEDFTQKLFERFLRKESFAAADRSRGRLRSYLLTSLRRLLAEDWRKGKTAKRGGNTETVSLDIGWAENRFRQEPEATESLSPEKQFDRRWLLVIMARVETALSTEYERAEKALIFGTLSTFLTMDPSPGAYAEAAEKLGIQESYVKVLVHRLRERFKSLLREEIGHTVQSSNEVEAELRHLREAFQ